MMPIGPLMVEHRWIERVIADLDRRLAGQPGSKALDAAYVDAVVDFLRSYADRCHHGKEEGILFRDLATKDLEPALAQVMQELMAEHDWARATTRSLVAANALFAQKEESALADVRRLLSDLAAFYPRHIKKEDDRFFRPVMGYFTAEEQHAMLAAFSAFDATLIHEKYRGIAQDLEGR